MNKINLPLNVNWKIARNSSLEKNNYIIKASDQSGSSGIYGLGEVAFNVRYGESEKTIEDGFKRFQKDWNPDWYTVEEFGQYISSLENMPASLKFGLESSFVHYLSLFVGKDIPSFLRLKKINGIATSFSLPILSCEEITQMVHQRKLQRFSFLKLKIDRTDVVEKVQALASVYSGQIRIDANEAFTDIDEFLQICQQLKGINIQFIEQPFPAHLWDAYIKFKTLSPYPIFADESVTSGDITKDYVLRFHGVNIKLMKSGGVFRAINQLKTARALGLKTMLGCMIETSLGISWAMQLASLADYFDLDGHLLLKKDPFNFIQEEDGKLIWPEFH